MLKISDRRIWRALRSESCLPDAGTSQSMRVSPRSFDRHRVVRSPMVQSMSLSRCVLPPLLLFASAAHAETSDEPASETIAARASANEDLFTPGLSHAAAAGLGSVTA